MTPTVGNVAVHDAHIDLIAACHQIHAALECKASRQRLVDSSDGASHIEANAIQAVLYQTLLQEFLQNYNRLLGLIEDYGSEAYFTRFVRVVYGHSDFLE